MVLSCSCAVLFECTRAIANELECCPIEGRLGSMSEKFQLGASERRSWFRPLKNGGKKLS